jgi:hypothetical protein
MCKATNNADFSLLPSIGTTARCGLWPVEQYPSIFSYLSPTLPIVIKSIQIFPLFDFCNNKFFYCVGLLAPHQTPQNNADLLYIIHYMHSITIYYLPNAK